jgi:hypothetical protein
MMTIMEVIEYFKQHDLIVDELTMERWIRQRKIVAVRSGNGSREWRVPTEALIPILLEHLREENLWLKKQLHDRLHGKKTNQATQEEPPF